jgi:hypothetical protein
METIVTHQTGRTNENVGNIWPNNLNFFNRQMNRGYLQRNHVNDMRIHQLRYSLTVVWIFIISTSRLTAQDYRVTGKVVSEEFEFLNGAVIQTKDSTILGRVDDNGLFEIELSKDIRDIQIWFVGMESETLKLSGKCNYLEIILLNDIIVEFETVKEAKKRFNKRRKELPELYEKAWKQGVFQNEEPCR